MLCLTKKPFHAHWQYDKVLVAFEAWNTKMSRFPNVFLSVTILEMRKHADSKHPDFPMVGQPHINGVATLYVTLSNAINNESWHLAALRWNEQKTAYKTRTEKLSQEKTTKELKKWSLDSFGYDYTSVVSDMNSFKSHGTQTQIVGRKRCKSFLPIHKESCSVLISPLKRELTTLEKEMSTSEFILYSCKNSPPCPELSVTEQRNIASMSFSDFIIYSEQVRQRRETENIPRVYSVSRYDELEDFSDEVTFGSTMSPELNLKSNGIVDSPSLLETRAITFVPVHVGMELREYDSANSVHLERVTPPCRSHTHHFSLPALRDCPLDPHFVDERLEWGEDPPLCNYSPSIMLTPVGSQHNTRNAEQPVLRHNNGLKMSTMRNKLLTNLELKLNTLREKNHLFMDYFISPKYKNYKQMYESIFKLINMKALELSLCDNKSRRQIICTGMFCQIAFKFKSSLLL